LKRLAGISGVDTEAFVRNAALRLLDEAEYLAAIQKGIDEADRGEFIDEEEMDVRFKKMLSS